MTQTTPTVLLLLDSSMGGANYQQWLTSDDSWQSVVLEEQWPDGMQAVTTMYPVREGTADATAPDVIVLDESVYDAAWEPLQRVWRSPPACVVLLEDGDEARSAAVLAAGARDYLVKPHLNGVRFRQTVQLLCQQAQLEKTLHTCQHQNVFNQAAVGINQADITGRFIRANQHFCDLLGYRESELLQLTYQAITHPDDLAVQAEYERRLFEGEASTVAFEKRYLTKAGEPVWTRVTLTTVRDEAGRPVSDFAVVEDIRDRKRMEAVLKESEARFKAIHDQAAVGISLASPVTGAVVSANQWFCDFLGYREAELQQMHYADYSHPDDYHIDDVQMQRLIAGEISNYTIEKRFFHRSGEVRWTSITVSLVRNAEGRVLYDVAIIQDIRDRKRAEAELREHRDFLQTILNNLPVSLFVKDARPDRFGQYMLVNPCCEAIFGCQRQAILGKTDYDFFPPKQADRFAQVDRDVLSEQTKRRLEEPFEHPHLGRLILDTIKVPIYSADQQPKYILGISRDVTAYRRAQADLRRSEAHLLEAQRLAHLGHWEYDPSESVLSCSPEALRIYGFDESAEKPSFDDFIARIHPHDRPKLLQAIQQLTQERTAYAIRHRIIWPDGRTRYVFCRGRAIVDEHCQGVKAFVTSQDLTEAQALKQALQVSEQKHRALINALPDLIIHMSSDGICLDFFAARSMVALDNRECVLGRHIYDSGLPRALAERRLDSIQTALKTGELQIYEQTLFNGRAQVVEEVRISPCGEHEVLTIIRDVTARKQDEARRTQAEQALEEALEFNRTIITSAQEGIIVLDREFRYRAWNPYMEQISGIPAATVLDRQPLTVFPQLEQTGVYASMQRALAGDIVIDPDRPFHISASNKTGWTSDMFSPLRDSQGRIIGVLGLIRDVSDRKQTELALQESEEKFRQLAENIEQVFFIHDAKTRETIYVSPAFECIWGIPCEQMYADPFVWLSIVHPDDLPQLSAAIAARYAGKMEDINYRIVRSDGGERWIRSRAFPVVNADGEIYRIAGIAEDVSDRKQAEAALYKLNDKLEERVRQRTHELAQSEQDLRTIFNNVYDAILIHDLDGTILDVNDRALEMMAATREQLLGALPADLSACDCPTEQLSGMFQRVKLGEAPRFEWQGRKLADGTVFDAEVSLLQITLRDRPVIIACVRDISDRKRAENELIAERLRLQLALDAADMGTWSCLPTENRLIWSATTERIFGFEPGTFQGDRDTVIAMLHPDDREQTLRTVNRTFATGAPYRAEYRIRRRDGEIRWVSVLGILAPSEASDPHLIGVAADITERKQAELALQESRNMLKLVLDAIPQRVFWKDRESRFLGCNPAFAKDYGLTHHTVVGKTDTELQCLEWAHAFQEDDQQVIESGISKLNYEEQTTNLRGEHIWVRTSKIPLTNSKGDVVGILGCYDDVTDRKRAEQALRQANAELEERVAERTAELVEAKETAESANRAKSIFLANMSHELRTPLNAILGFSQLMVRDPDLSAKHLEELTIINRSGEHLLTLINDILEMSKIEAGQSTYSPTSVELSELLDGLSDMLRLRAESKGVSFTIDCHPLLPQFIRTDSHKLRQVLLNLLSNAIKFTQIGYVSLRVEPASCADSESISIDKADSRDSEPDVASTLVLRFEVEDSGVGISLDELNTLFKPFVQTASGRLSQEGTGLGLPISRQFVQLMGGDLAVSSQPGEGSTFSFEIPVQVVECSEFERPEPLRRAIAIASDQPEYRILVAEDNWASRILLQNLLMTLGFKVQTAVDGNVAVECWQRWQPHLVFMDIRMPVMNGCQATQEIRRREQTANDARALGQTRHTKIISLTAGVFRDNRAEFTSLGFDDSIHKPIQEAVISQTIARHLGVTFLYESESDAAGRLTPSPTSPVTVESLKTLPIEWVRQLHDAIMRLDQNQMLSLVAKISDDHASLAQAIAQKVQDFDYETLLSLIQVVLGSQDSES